MYPNREAAACSVNRVQFKAQRGTGGVLWTMMYSRLDHQGHGFSVPLLYVCVYVCEKTPPPGSHKHRHKTIINSSVFCNNLVII